MPVSVMKAVLSKSEFNGWMKYFREKPADIQEIQLATISSIIVSALGGKGKVTDFIISNKGAKKQATPDEIASVFRNMM